ncbi:MAG: nucleotidyl transferase AbiEii/AbiGii toxin family protein [Marinisporobacter sp.]|jgi:hypothetical protein|nr:nucleotidyl transferase AbiEii/AbiGii toxin family protein [Marinisporobacter sp.]MCV6599653.1 nucleotidyl transferase AbiEii/AbiGii toxin family protein [Alphaproteobacteria bacterium]
MKLETLRKLVIQSLFADDDFFDLFTLKGGNALLVHKINARASIDIDVSMENSFEDKDLDSTQQKFEKSLKDTFSRENYTVIDVKLKKKPKKMPKEKEKFWGGYTLEFKIVSLENKSKLDSGSITLAKLRNLALSVEDSTLTSSTGGKVFKVDISKYEYCKSKIEKDLDGFPIYVYTPIAIVYEKLRAICQQHEEYNNYVETNRKPRARDFFDIYTVLEFHNGIVPTIKKDILKESNLNDLVNIFTLKKVPLDFLSKVKNYRDFHRENFISVKDTVSESVTLESYDFYFDYVSKLCNQLSNELANLNMLDNIPSND